MYHFADLVVGFVWLRLLRFLWFFSPLGIILYMFFENSVKLGGFFTRLTWTWWPKKKKSIHGVWHQMKGYDFSIRPSNVLDQLKVIWPHHDRKFDLRWPPWPQQWLLLIPCHVTYQKKGNDFSIRLFNVLDPLEVIWPHNDQKCDLRWPLWPQ